ncbi:MAG: SCO family protein [Bacteroidota bacterium]
MKTLNIQALIILMGIVISCNNKQLPILGETTVNDNGKTIHYMTPEFELVTQDNTGIHSASFEGKIQVVDFFFTSCPTICPKMTSHLKLVEAAFKDEKKVQILSFSIDPKNDTPKHLKAYASQYDIDTANWTFLTSENGKVFELAKDYKVRAFNDSTENEPSLLHDGTFVLVDGTSRIRGYYNGLEIEDTKRLIKDIKLLLKEG